MALRIISTLATLALVSHGVQSTGKNLLEIVILIKVRVKEVRAMEFFFMQKTINTTIVFII